MSFNVLVIPEDFRKDQYVLQPIVSAMLASAVGNAKVRVCRDPLLGGVVEATNWDRISEIIDRYKGMINLFLLIIDRDCKAGRRESLNKLEQKAVEKLDGSDRVFLAENAWQELEVWTLAGHDDLPKGWKWSAIRSECHPKETYYDEFARSRGLDRAPYEGRDTLSREAAKNYKRIRTLCPEDVKALEDRIRKATEAEP